MEKAHAVTIDLLDAVKVQIVNPLIWLLLGLALVVFLYGVYEFIMGAENEEKRRVGAQHIVWGVIGLAIMLSVFGIIRLIYFTFEIPTQ